MIYIFIDIKARKKNNKNKISKMIMKIKDEKL